MLHFCHCCLGNTLRYHKQIFFEKNISYDSCENGKIPLFLLCSISKKRHVTLTSSTFLMVHSEHSEFCYIHAFPDNLYMFSSFQRTVIIRPLCFRNLINLVTHYCSVFEGSSPEEGQIYITDLMLMSGSSQTWINSLLAHIYGV